MSFYKDVIDKLPYADGTGRRRFISGSILLLGFTIMEIGWVSFESSLSNLIDLVNIPVVVAGIVLIIYSIGNLIELFSENIWVRAVSGIYWSVGYTFFPLVYEKNKPKVFFSRLIRLPYLVTRNFVLGIIGITEYKIFFDNTEINAIKKLNDSAVEDGITHPLGNNAKLAVKVLIDELPTNHDQKWANMLVNRTKDVSTLTTTIFILLITSLALGRFDIETSSEIKNQMAVISKKVESLTFHDRDSINAKSNLRGYLSEYNSTIDYSYFNNFIEELGKFDKAQKELSINDSIKVVVSSQIESLRKDIYKLMKQHSDHYFSLEANVLRVVKYTLLISFFLFLYIGYFNILKSSTKSIVRLYAIRS